MRSKINKLRKLKFIRYLVVGGSAFVLEMAILYIFKNVLNLGPVQSVAISFWISFVYVFLAQKHVTFKTEETHAHPLHKQTIAYSILVAWNYFFSLITMHIFADHLGVFITRTFAIMVMTLWNFQIYKRIFKTDDKNQENST